MNTFLGISALLSPADVDAALVASAQIVYCEGYLWDVDIAKEAIRKAMDIAKGAGRKVALTLSDSFCVDRHRDEWRDLVRDKVDIVFANEAELCALYECDWTNASRLITRDVAIGCLTRSERGSTIVSGDERVDVDAHPVARVLDTTGAGDLYASGFLFGYARGFDLRRCAELAGRAAAEIIGHLGARPARPLTTLVG
jgi:sugar/nucleoside kinase (ribokinase family)